MKLTRRWKWSVALAAAAVAIGVMMARPEVIAIDMVVIESGPFSVTIDEDGVTRFRDHAVIAAPVTGRLLEAALRAGDPVRRGQVVARIAPAPLDERTRGQAEAALAAAASVQAEAAARVDQAEALLVDARRDRERAERLGAAGAMADREVESARTAERLRERELDAARAARVAAENGERQAQAALLGAAPSGSRGTVEVRSPLDGRVLRMAEEHERVVVAGSPLLEVGVPGGLEVVVDVLSSDAARITTGATVLIHQPTGDTLRASVRRIEPAAFTKVSPLGVEEQRVNLRATLSATAPGLGDGFRVRASIVLWSAEDVVTVPSTSLVPAEEGWAVYVVERGRAAFRPVTLGQRGARAVEVVAGIRPGEVVVRHPDERIQAGVRVVER